VGSVDPAQGPCTDPSPEMAAKGEAQVVQSDTVVLPEKPRTLFNRPTTSFWFGFSNSMSVGTMVEEPVREISRVERMEEHVAVAPSFADVATSKASEHAKLLDTAGAERVTLMTEPLGPSWAEDMERSEVMQTEAHGVLTNSCVSVLHVVVWHDLNSVHV
jgi:hypothetical protein